MKFSTIINFSVLAFFTLLFVNDFFPATTIAEVFSQKIILFIIIALVILQLAVTKGRERNLSKKAYFGLTIYIFSLWIVLTLFGGKSQAGLSFNGPFFYIVVLLLSLDLLRMYRKEKNKEAN